jgi:uncharacterized protein (UPF0261 family)
LVDEVAGGTTTAGPDRLEMAGALGIPQVVSVGASDQITFRPPSAVPAHMSNRRSYQHNPAITLIRSNKEEVEEYGRLLCSKLNAAHGPVSVFLPLRGTSEYAVAGGVFHDPEVDAALFAAIRENLGSHIDLVEMDMDINQPEFGRAMASRLHEMYQQWSKARDRDGKGAAV